VARKKGLTLRQAQGGQQLSMAQMQQTQQKQDPNQNQYLGFQSFRLAPNRGQLQQIAAASAAAMSRSNNLMLLDMILRSQRICVNERSTTGECLPAAARATDQTPAVF
jgi:hypothetical protein